MLLDRIIFLITLFLTLSLSQFHERVDQPVHSVQTTYKSELGLPLFNSIEKQSSRAQNLFSGFSPYVELRDTPLLGTLQYLYFQYHEESLLKLKHSYLYSHSGLSPPFLS